MPVRLSRTPAALAALTAVAVFAVTAPAAAQTDVTARPDTAPPRHVTGTLPDGATWIADVPADWNGTLLLFAHGFGPTVAQNAPDPAVRDHLLAEGYTPAGSSYDPEGPMRALNSAEARIALAAACLNLPAWSSGEAPPPRHDAEARREQQYAWPAQGLLSFIEGGRHSIEQSAGGNTSWNEGVDHPRLLAGHCAFTTAEYVAAAHAVDARIDSGRWGGRARPAVPRRAALELDLDGAAYVPCRPAELVVGREKGGGHR